MPDENISTTLPDPASLINREAIRVADAARDATLAADRQVHQALKVALEAVAQANRDADAAITGGGDALAAERAVADAEMCLRVAQRRAAAAAAAAAEAPAIHRQTVGEAHRAAVFAAIEARLDACRRSEAALAEIAAAKAAFDAATAAMLAFANAGCPIRGAMDAPREVRSLDAELRHWSGNQVDLSTRRFFPGEVA